MTKKYEGILKSYEGKIESLAKELSDNNISFVIVLDDNNGEGLTTAGYPREHSSYLIKRMSGILEEHYKTSRDCKEPTH